MFLDPAHQLAVSIRIMRKSADVVAESTDMSVTCQRAEALYSIPARGWLSRLAARGSIRSKYEIPQRMKTLCNI